MKAPKIPDALFDLVTAQEAARLWQKNRHTIYRAIDFNRVEARKAQTVWLITRQSLEKLWGKPKVDLLETLFN
jgi:Helix-turn-helix domain